MRDHELREQIHHMMDTQLSDVKGDPYLAQRIIVDAKGGQKVKRKISAGLVFCFVLLALSVVALAATLLNEHQVEMFENVDIRDLLPEQWQQYDVCHKVSSGYLVGGFELGDDYIAPMGEEDKILYLSDTFTPVWTLNGAELNGCLFDKVAETEESFYFGMERQKEEWIASLMKVSKQGNILWMWEGENGFKIKDFLTTAEDVVYCVGTSSENTAVLLKLDRDGNLEWKKDFKEYDVTVLNAISNWEGGLLGIGQCNEGIVLFKLDKNGVVNSYVVHSIDRQIDAVRLQELTDGRTALILTLSSASSNRDVTQETKYMIVTDDIFQ